MKYSKEKIAFLDTLIYKEKNNNIQTTIYKKPADHQNYIHSKSVHPFSQNKTLHIAKYYVYNKFGQQLESMKIMQKT